MALEQIGEKFPYEFRQYFDATGKGEKGVSMVKGKLRGLRKLAQEAREVSLSKKEDATIVLNKLGDLFDREEEVTISYDLFLQRTNALFERCIRCVEQALTVRDLAKESIDAVLMVGGSSNFLEVRDRVRGFFGGKDVIWSSIENPLSTAKGAGLMALQIGAHPELFSVGEVCPMSLGFCFRNEKTGLDSVQHVIRASDPIPKTVTHGCTTVFDNQTLALIKIYQGNEDVALDWNVIMSFHISNLPPRKAREVESDETLSYDENWLATISSVVKRPVGVKIKGNANCSFSMAGMELAKNRRQVVTVTCEDFV